MAGTTYLIRAVPFVLFRKKLKNRFLRSFFEYIPYTVLSAMTFPAVLYTTGSMTAAAAGLAAALILSLTGKKLITVAAGACAAALLASLILSAV